MMVTNLKGKKYTQRLEELGLGGADREGESELLDLVPDVYSTR